MRNKLCRTLLWLTAVFELTSLLASANTNVHTAWLWHLHQPIYWPDRAPANHSADHYQNAWDTLQLDNSGFGHPSDTSLSSVFGEADRLNAYQGEPNTTLQDWLDDFGLVMVQGAMRRYTKRIKKEEKREGTK